MTHQPHPGALALQAAAEQRLTFHKTQNMGKTGDTPAPVDGPPTLREAATRLWSSYRQLRESATPGCPTCAGIGFTRQRVEHGFAGEEARACHCTGVA